MLLRGLNAVRTYAILHPDEFPKLPEDVYPRYVRKGGRLVLVERPDDDLVENEVKYEFDEKEKWDGPTIQYD